MGRDVSLDNTGHYYLPGDLAGLDQYTTWSPTAPSHSGQCSDYLGDRRQGRRLPHSIPRMISRSPASASQTQASHPPPRTGPRRTPSAARQRSVQLFVPSNHLRHHSASDRRQNKAWAFGRRGWRGGGYQDSWLSGCSHPWEYLGVGAAAVHRDIGFQGCCRAAAPLFGTPQLGLFVREVHQSIINHQ